MPRKSTAPVRRAALALTTATLAGLALAAPAPAAAAKPGSYKGKTAQGLPVQFEVAKHKVGNFYYKVRPKPRCNQPAGWRPGDPTIYPDQGYGSRGTPTPPDKIQNGKFRLKNRDDRSVPPLVKGKFVNKRKVEGRVAYGCVSDNGDVSYKYLSFRAKHV